MLARVKPWNLMPLLASLAWTFFAVALAGWWLYFSLVHLDPHNPLSAKHRHMLVWEGSFFLAVLFVGGAAMTLLTYREKKRAHQFRELVGAFSHELKTSIARLRLDTENLEASTAFAPNLKEKTSRIVEHSVELERQLHNALLYSQENEYHFHSKRISLALIKEHLLARFPQLQFQGFAQGYVVANQTALDLMISNLIHNARHHGKANTVTLIAESVFNDSVQFTFSDDGSGVTANLKTLGNRPGEGDNKGSGLGLYLVRRLGRWMNTEILFQARRPNGLAVSFKLPGDLS